MAESPSISSFNTTPARELFQDPDVQQLLTANKVNVRPVISFQVSQDILGFKKQLLFDLNQKLFNLKISSERLTDPSYFSSLHFLSVVSSDALAIRATAEGINSDAFQSKIASASAEEITGNASAGEYTALTGVFGYLLIEGQRLPIGTNPYETESDRGYPDTLIEIKNRINSRDIETRADIVNGRLVLYSPQGRTLSVGDFTDGGETNGLQLVSLPQREASDIFSGFLSGVNPRVDTTFADVQTLRSFSADDISVNALADSSTPLYGVSGDVVVNGIPVSFGKAGVADSLESFANRINALSSQLSAAAYVENNRLVLASTDFTKPLDVQDKTTGGSAGGPGGLGLSRSANSGSADTSAASSLGLYDVTVIGLAGRQKNVSYSAAEITGSSSAAETTALGLSGNLEINGTRIYLMTFESLKDVASVINGMGAGVTASVVENRLVLESNRSGSVGFTLADNSSGGAKGGLGIGTVSRSVQSVPVAVILGNINADSNTFLGGVSGFLQFKNANTTLAAPTLAGDTIITVTSAAGLQAEDVLTFEVGTTDEEERQIVSISGTTVTLDVALANPHAALDSVTNIRSIQVGLQGTSDTLARLVLAINNDGGAGVTAAIENGRIVLRASQPAMPSITDATTGGYAGTSGSFGFKLSSSTVVQAQNAVYQINGVTHSQSTNTVSDGVPGVRFQLQSATSTDAQTIQVSTQVTDQDNVAHIEDMIKNFVLRFNDSLSTLNRLTEYDTLKEEEGEFFQNAGLAMLKNSLVSAVNTPVKTSELSELSIKDIGAALDEKLNGILNSTLSLDEDKLHGQITKDLRSVVSLFNAKYNGIGARISSILNALIRGDGIPKIDIRLEDKFTLIKQLQQQQPVFFDLAETQKGLLFSEQA